MGLFGNQDAAEVSDNPFYVAPDIYQCVLSQFELRYNEQKDTHSLLFQWTIEDEDNQYEGMNVSEWIVVYVTEDERASASQREISMNQARLKSRLTALGMTTAEMNALVDDDGVFNEDLAGEYVGVSKSVEVVEKADKNDPDVKYTNIKKVSPLDED